MLKILGHEFEEDFSNRESSVDYRNSERLSSPYWKVECIFKEKAIGNDIIRPIIGIEYIDVDCPSFEALKGENFICEDFEEAESREDYLYFYDQEAFQNYEIKIVDIKDHKAHVICKGVATLDSDEEPMITAEFEWDTWLPIIVKYEDWEKYNLDN